MRIEEPWTRPETTDPQAWVKRMALGAEFQEALAAATAITVDIDEPQPIAIATGRTGTAMVA